jgi:hypothetical protein
MTLIFKDFHKPCLLVFLLLVSAPVLAQPAAGDNQSLLTPFPNSTLVSSESLPNVVYQVPLDILRRTGGRTAPEKSLRVNGSLNKLLYEVTPNFSGGDVQAFLKQQFSEAGFEPLFACEGRSCGSSNDWANDVFSNRVLYGPAQNQFFMAYVDRSSTRPNFVVSYIITRGNGRLYSYIELLESNAAAGNASGLSESLLRNGFTVLSNLTFEEDELAPGSGSLPDLVSVLKLNPELDLYIVSHLHGAADFDAIQARAQKRADSVVAALIEAGVDAARVTAKGIGPLAPRCGEDACRNRVEAVLR